MIYKRAAQILAWILPTSMKSSTATTSSSSAMSLHIRQPQSIGVRVLWWFRWSIQYQTNHRAGTLIDCSSLICSGIAENDEVDAVEDFIDVSNILAKILVVLCSRRERCLDFTFWMSMSFYFKWYTWYDMSKAPYDKTLAYDKTMAPPLCRFGKRLHFLKVEPFFS